MTRPRGPSGVVAALTLFGAACLLALPSAVLAAPLAAADPPLFAIGAALEDERPAPSGVVVDGDGDVYVSDYVGDRVLKYAPDGQLLAAWGAPGAAPGSFSGPFGLALDDHGGLYVADQLNNRVQRFATDGSYLGVLGSAGAGVGQLRTPFGVAAFGGTVLVADFGNDRVQVFTHESQVVRAWGSRGSGPGQFTRPLGIAVDRDGGMYVSDHFNDRVQRFGADGRFVAEIGTARASSGATPAAVALTPAPFSTPPPETSLAENQLARPEGLALDRDGNLLVADYGRNRIVRFAPDGQVLKVWGARGSGNGELLSPKGVAVDPASGLVYVADTGNGRLQRFLADGTFDAVWPLPPLAAPGGPAPGPATPIGTALPSAQQPPFAGL